MRVATSTIGSSCIFDSNFRSASLSAE